MMKISNKLDDESTLLIHSGDTKFSRSERSLTNLDFFKSSILPKEHLLQFISTVPQVITCTNILYIDL